MQFIQKFNLVKSLSDVVLHQKHLGRLASLGLNGLYLGTLLLTPPAILVTAVGMENVSNVVTIMSGDVPKKDWDKEIAEANISEKRFDLMLDAAQFFIATNEPSKALGYLETAEKTFAAINTDSALARLYQAYSFYYQSQNDLNRAEEYLVKVIKLHRQLPDQHAVQLAANYQSLADLRRQQDKLEEFESDLQSGLTFALRIKNPEERFIISSIVGLLLDTYYQTSQLDKAQKLLTDTLSALGGTENTLNRYIEAYLHQELGWLNAEMSNITTAMDEFNIAMDLNKGLTGQSEKDSSDPLASLNIHLAMAATQYKQGNLTIAESEIKKAEKLANANFYPSLGDYIQIYLPDAMPGEISNNLSRESARWKLISEAYKSFLPDTNMATQRQ